MKNKRLELLGDRNFIAIGEGTPKTIFNLEYVLSLNWQSERVVKRGGSFLETEDRFPYSVTGSVVIKPGEESDFLRQSHENSVHVTYCLGERVRTTLEPDRNKIVKEFYLPEEIVKEIIQCYFPHAIMAGDITIAAEREFPGDTTPKNFGNMFGASIHSEMIKLQAAQENFVEAYGNGKGKIRNVQKYE